MEIGFVGLGKMGMNMVTRLTLGGHRVVAYDTDGEKRSEALSHGAQIAHSLSELTQVLSSPRLIWVMVPSGDPTEQVLEKLGNLLHAGDVIADGGNSYFRDSIRRSQTLLAKGIHLLDAGTSGGIWGLKNGYCLMVGGTQKAFSLAEPALKTLAPTAGYLHVGPTGAGHYVKMVHNGIEYGLMQAYGEGFALLDAAKETLGYQYDLQAVGSLWGKGSVVRSWLLELLVDSLSEDPHLEQIAGKVADSGEGRWTVKESIDASIPTPVLTLALQMRFLSRMDNAFSARVCAALRQKFGGHSVISRSQSNESIISKKD